LSEPLKGDENKRLTKNRCKNAICSSPSSERLCKIKGLENIFGLELIKPGNRVKEVKYFLQPFFASPKFENKNHLIDF
jgi:hypothetical protein